MEKHPIEGIMTTTMENIRDMIDVNTIVGDAIVTSDGSTVIPISRVSFGFVAGGGEYAVQSAPRPDPTQPKPEPAPAASQPVPAWAKTTALLAPTVGLGITGAGIGLHYAAPGLIAMAHALWATVALIAADTLPLLLLRARRRATPHITHHTHVTANGLFGRASNTINH